MTPDRLALALVVAFFGASGAWARDIVVQVDATSGPWSVAVNGTLLPYGSGDERAATIVPLDVGGGRLGLFAEGTTDTPDKQGVGPGGIEDDAVDDRTGPKKRRYPSFYTPKILYPANRHGLVAIFVDAKGVAISRPLMVGADGIAVPIPEGAEGVAFGFNDISYAGNRGTLKVTVQVPD